MKKQTKKIVANIIVVALLIAGIVWVCAQFWHVTKTTYTNNAQVYQHIAPVSSKVPGFIKEIRFDEFQHVKKGDTLVLIEDAEFRLQLAQARANYKNATVGKAAMNTSIRTTQNNIAVSDANLREMEIRLQKAEADYLRYKNLYESETVTKAEFEGVKTQYEAMKASYETMKQQQQSTRLVKSEQTQRLDQNDAGIAIAEAALNLAELNLSYTVITAPCDGYTSPKTIHEGELIQPGMNLVSIVSDEDYWVIANYREKQLRHLNVGSKMKITVDALPNQTFHGTVTAISNATGARYSIVPQDNSTGNFVKTEQRVPVKIAFDADNDAEVMKQLRAGLNVECEIEN